MDNYILLDAARDGNLNMVKRFIEKGVNIETTDDNGWTALQIASRQGHLDIVKYLVNKGANVNREDNFSWSPLTEAAWNNHVEIVKYLVDYGADINAITPSGMDLVYIADTREYPELLKFLIKRGADWTSVSDNSIFLNILKEETNNLKSGLTRDYLTLEQSTPQTVTGEGKVKSAIPKNLLLKSVYENPYQELCTKINKDYPPIKLLALANILKIDYDIDISWTNLCDKTKQALYLLL